MRGRGLLVAAVCCVGGVRALLLPPRAHVDSNINAVFDPKAQNVRLPCPACTFPPKNDAQPTDDFLRLSGGPDDVVLSFRVSRDGERLELDGEAVYPLQSQSSQSHSQHPIYVSQIPAYASDVDVASNQATSTPLRVTSSALRVEAEQSVPADNSVVVPLRYQIVGLEGRSIVLDEVAIQLLKTGDGKLLMVRVDVLPSSEPARLPFDSAREHSAGTEDCAMLPAQLCKLKNLFEAKMEEFRHSRYGPPPPCIGHRHGPPPAGRRPPPGPPPTDFESIVDLLNEEEDTRHHHHGRPHHMKPYFSHHGPHEHDGPSFFHSFARGLIAVLIPIFAGIAVGLSVSFLGLVVGRLMGDLWTVCTRDRRPRLDLYHEGAWCGHNRVQRQLDAGMHADVVEQLRKHMEESGLLEEALPAYEDAPIYEEAPSYEESEKGRI